MKKLWQLLLVLTFVAALQAQPPTTQEPKPPSEVPYKVTLKVSELEDGKKINERSYVFPAVATLQGQRSRPSGIKVGVRTPITVNDNDKARQIQYLDVGINIDCTLEDVDGKLTASLSIEMSNFALPEQAEDPRRGGDPVLRQLKQNFRVQLPPGKSVQLTSLDDINSKKRTQIEVTATKFE